MIILKAEQKFLAIVPEPEKVDPPSKIITHVYTSDCHQMSETDFACIYLRSSSTTWQEWFDKGVAGSILLILSTHPFEPVLNHPPFWATFPRIYR